MNNDFLNSERENSTRKRKKIRMSDIIIYVVCLVISFGVWVYVVGVENENYEYTFENVAVQFRGVNELTNERSLSILSGYDTKINVTVVGSRREIIKYTAEDIYAYIDLDDVDTASRHALEVSIDLPDNMKLVSSSATKVNVVVDETVTMTFDIDIEKKNISIASDLTLHEAQVSADKVAVTGPKTMLDQISKAKIVCDFGTVTTSVKFKSTVQLVDEEGNDVVNPYIKTDVSEVKVEFPVTMEKLLALSPVYEADDQDKFNYSVTFDPQMLKVTGDPQVVSAMSEIKVDIGNITNVVGKGVVDISKIELLEDVKLYDEELKNVSFDVKKTVIDTSGK